MRRVGEAAPHLCQTTAERSAKRNRSCKWKGNMLRNVLPCVATVVRRLAECPAVVGNGSAHVVLDKGACPHCIPRRRTAHQTVPSAAVAMDIDAAPRPHGMHKFGLVHMNAFELAAVSPRRDWEVSYRCGSCRWAPGPEDYWQHPEQALVQCRVCQGYRCSWCRLDRVPECVNCPAKEVLATTASSPSPFDYSGNEVYCKICHITFSPGEEAEHAARCGSSLEPRLGASSPEATPSVGVLQFDNSGDAVYCKVCCISFSPGEEAEHAALCGNAGLCDPLRLAQPLKQWVEANREQTDALGGVLNSKACSSPWAWDTPRFNWWHPGQFEYRSLPCEGDRNIVCCKLCKVTFRRGQEGMHGSGRRHSALMDAPWPEPFCPGRAGTWGCNAFCRCRRWSK